MVITRHTFVVLALAFGFLSNLAGQQAAGRSEESAIKQVVDQYMQELLQKSPAPGAIVGVSFHGQRYFFTYGKATDDGTPFKPDTLVEIGSCTKVFTTTLFALAVGRGQIASDGPAQKYMPNGFTLQPGAQQITPLQLSDFALECRTTPPISRPIWR